MQTETPMEILIVHRGAQDGKPLFAVEHNGNRETATPLTPPDQDTVPGRPTSNLQKDLRWYLEDFLDLPTGEYIALSKRVLDEIKRWGKECFDALFNGRQAFVWYQKAIDEGLENLRIKIVSDDPRILAWPWEALTCDRGSLAHLCRIERRLQQHNDERPLPSGLPADCLNVLLVIARPGGVNDVGFHSVSRPLVKLAREKKSAIRIDLLRPPTFARLRQVLREKKNFYHVLHFDGHGRYDAAGQEGEQGALAFELEDGGADLKPSATLAALLAEAHIPVMVMNACQSATINEKADTPFMSVAVSLVNGGVRSVVAMGYSLYVSGAQQFVPAFYERLLENRNVAEAVRAGRQQMLQEPKRPCMVGELPLEDWLVPVLYQRYETVLPKREGGSGTSEDERAALTLPDEMPALGDYGFIGREAMIRSLEEACQRQKQGAILIHGMAGMGKTTLAKGFLHWLNDTHWPGNGMFWINFEGLRSAEFVVNRLLEKLAGINATAAPLEEKVKFLTKTFRENPFILVWDNFESVSGIDGVEGSANLSKADRDLLREFIGSLRGGKSKIIITSRSPERWLGIRDCFPLELGGLRGEELWAYCNGILRDYGRKIDRSDPDFRKLVAALDGHPLALQAVLPLLGKHTVSDILNSLQQAMQAAEGDAGLGRLQAALDVLGRDLPDAFIPILQLLGLHEGFADIGAIEIMLGDDPAKAQVGRCMERLETAGLCSLVDDNIYRLHPALHGYLRQRHPADEGRCRAFVELMGRYANHLTPKELHEQRVPFYFHEMNFRNALKEAERMKMDSDSMALLQSLASYALNCRNYHMASAFWEQLVQLSFSLDNHELTASAYHQLGMIAQEQRDFTTAEGWYRKALEIKEKQENEHGAALTYHQLGVIAQKQRDFATAEGWYRKALEIKEKQGNEHGAASTYHQLGMIAEERGDLAGAEGWYRKALVIFDAFGDTHNADIVKSSLARLAKRANE